MLSPILRHIKLTVIVLSTILFTSQGCRKDVEVFTESPAGINAVEELLTSLGNPASTSVFTLSKPDSDQYLITPGGVRISLVDTDQLFKNALGQTVPCSSCNELKIEITVFSAISDLLAAGIQTVTDTGDLFRCGGVVILKAYCNNEPLQIIAGRNVKIQIPASQPVPGLSLLRESASGGLWQFTPQEVYIAEWQSLSGNTLEGYELVVQETGRIAAGKLFPDPKINFCIDLPAGYSDENTRSFIVFPQQNSLVLLNRDPLTESYCTESAPSGGYPVRLVSVSKLGEYFWLGQKVSETTTSGVKQTDSVHPSSKTTQEIVSFLKNL